MALDVLCLHGVNVDENGPWLAEWTQAIRDGSAGGFAFAAHELRYNALFNAKSSTSRAYLSALKQLLDSYWRYRTLSGREAQRGLRERIEASIGMVAKWVAYPDLRAQLRADLKQCIQQVQPQLICAHSLGSLIAYDLLRQEQPLVQGRVLITLGSQIGHPGLREVFGGKVEPLDTARHWFHLFNDEDALFTCELDFESANFTQIDAYFDIAGWLDHDATSYLADDATAREVWPSFGAARPGAPRTLARVARRRRAAKAAWFTPPMVRAVAPKKQRALLIGINEYINPEDQLAGCVNDVFLMSSLLQERGYEPEAIRLVLDERATTSGVKRRLDWLFDGVRSGDERVLFFSGHGARVAELDAAGEPDHKDEVLVTHDFDWEGNLGISDDALTLYYANLPYAVKLTIILDCCHSGGMSRAGGRRIRGLDPPDDVAHRSIRWDRKLELWVPREKMDLKDRLDRQTRTNVRRFIGDLGDTQKIGRAVSLWAANPADYKEATRRFGHKGAYNPVVVAACREDQYAEEYRHGAASYGALTYVLAKELRRSAGKAPLEKLIEVCNTQMRSGLGLEQVAQLYRPPGHAQSHFPGQA